MHSSSLRKGKNIDILKLIKSCIGKAVIYKFVKHNYSTTLYIYNSIPLAYLSTNTCRFKTSASQYGNVIYKYIPTVF